MPHFTKSEYDRRLAATTEAMKARGLDAMLLFAQESMYWLTGYDTFGFCFFQCLVVKADGEMALLTRSADLRQARRTSIIPTVHVWRASAAANPAVNLREMLNDMGLLGAKLGVEYDTHGLTAKNGRALDETLSSFASCRDASDLVGNLRLVKSDEEIVFVRRAAEMADLALDAALETTKAGADEGAILAAMQGAVFAAGGDYPGNPFIIGSGEDALLCRYKAGKRTLDADDQLTIEWAGVFNQYHVAQMRTLVVGTPRERHRDLFEAAAEALAACEGAMVPGNTFGDVFAAHAKALDAHGLSKHRLNACGYSLGARFAPSWMEAQMFYAENPQAIAPNQTLFAHMILMDSETGTAMCLGRTYLTRDGAPEALTRHAPDFVVL